jgi:hypothetical protein
MCSTPNGSGDELEKFPDADAPLPIADASPPDAGMKSLDHCSCPFCPLRRNVTFSYDYSSECCVDVAADKRKLPRWRYYLRQKLLPLIRWETPYLAWMQDKMRSPALDSYFAITANLGTHTFFMTALPILFWCGHTSLGRG